MIQIFRYQYNTQEWHDLINSSLKGKERDNAINDFIKKNGTEVSIQEYLNDFNRRSFRDKGYSYKCFGEAENCIERLVYGELEYDEGLSYCNTREHCPEDLCESRTDWDDMKGYADGMAIFIDSLKSEVANGTIKVTNQKGGATIEQPEHSYLEEFEPIYHCGKKPTWKVGDTLAYYELATDAEGECIYGIVAEVHFDEEFKDWRYQLKDYPEYMGDGVIYEEELVCSEAYKV